MWFIIPPVYLLNVCVKYTVYYMYNTRCVTYLLIHFTHTHTPQYNNYNNIFRMSHFIITIISFIFCRTLAKRNIIRLSDLWYHMHIPIGHTHRFIYAKQQIQTKLRQQHHWVNHHYLNHHHHRQVYHHHYYPCCRCLCPVRKNKKKN